MNGKTARSAPCRPPPPSRAADRRPVTGARAEADLARLAWALAHPARVRIVRILAHRSTCVCGEIVAEFRLAQSTVSQHLKILKEAGLIRGTVDGPRTCYCLEPGALGRLRALVEAL